MIGQADASATSQNALVTSGKRDTNTPHRSSTFRSLVNFVSSPFKRSPVQSKRGEGQQRQIEAARPEEDVASESGSEDNWQGEPPADVFSLAAATRASESQQQKDEDMEVHVRLDAPPQQVPQHQSARSMLSKFLQAKAGAPMTPEDMRSFELLTERVAAEDGARSLANYGRQTAPAPFVFGTRGERAESTAFSFSSPNLFPTPKPLQRSQTTANIFAASTSKAPANRRPQYLGPGMSARRRPVASSTRLFVTPVLPGEKRKADEENETVEKKRRIDESPAPAPEKSSQSSGMSSSRSMPDFAHLRSSGQSDGLGDLAKSRMKQPQASQLRESVVATPSSPATPRSESEVDTGTTLSASTSASASARKRTADIMLDIIDASKPPVQEPPKKEIVNPYQSSLGASTSILHRSAMLRSTRKPATPKRKPASTPSTSGATPLGKTPTPLERIESAARQEAEPSPSKKVRGLVRDYANSTPSKISTPAADPFESEPTPEPQPTPKRPVPEPLLKSTPVPTPSIPEITPAKASFNGNSFASSSTKPIDTFHDVLSHSSAVPTPKPAFKPQPEHTRASSPPSEQPIFSPDSPKKSLAPLKSTIAPQTAREIALATPKLALPFYTFTVGFMATSTKPSAGAREQALKVSKEDLPAFSGWSTAAKGKGKEIIPAASAAVGGSMKWTCSLCSLSNPESAVKCEVCEEPRKLKSIGSDAPAAFNWGAAGGAPKSATGDQWKCSTCMLNNPADAVKCTVCEEPKPGGTTAAVSSAPKVPLAVAPVTQAFNWGAAGSAPKSAGTDVWKCPTCMLSNPNDAAKCTVCEEPMPGARTAAPAPQAFNWGAAGLTKPAGSAGWECSVCMVKNAADATQCVACETPK